MVAPEVIRANLVVGGAKNLVHKPFTVSIQAVVDDATQTRCLALEKRLDGVEKSAAKAQETMELRLTGVEARVADVNTAMTFLTVSRRRRFPP